MSNGVDNKTYKNDKKLLFLAALYGACVGIAAVSHVARSGAIHFTYSGDPLGTRSFTHLLKYPKQQDIFWYVFGLGVPICVAALMAFVVRRNIGRQKWAQPLPWVWSLGIYLIQAPLVLLGAWFGWAGAAIHVFLLLAIPFGLSRFLSDEDEVVFGKGISFAPSNSRLDILLRYILPFVILFIIYWKPSYPYAPLDLIDEEQHYSWIEAMLRGRWPGAETANKYGPLLEWLIYWLMLLKGMTMKSFRWISAASQLLAAALALLTIIRITKSRWVPWVGLIIILGFNQYRLSAAGHFFGFRGAFPLVAILVFAHQGRKRGVQYFLTGILATASLGIAVEFGIAALVGIFCAFILENFTGAPLDIRKLARRAGWFLLGMALIIVPSVVAYAAHGSLRLFITRYTEYMNAFRAGCLNLPFPPFPWLKWRSIAEWPQDQNLLMYLPPLIYILAAVDLISRRLAGAWDWEATIRSMPLLFGIVAFRVTLGRSDYPHMAYANFPASILFAWEMERAVSLIPRWGEWWRGKRIIAGIFFPLLWILITLSFFIGFSWGRTGWVVNRFAANSIGWRPATAERTMTQHNWASLDLPEAGGVWMPADLVRRIEGITAYIQTHTRPEDPIFIFPCRGSFFFFSHRPSATRFDIATDAVTSAQRKEVAETLREKRIPLILYLNCGPDIPYSDDHTEEIEAIKEKYHFKEEVMGATIFVPNN